MYPSLIDSISLLCLTLCYRAFFLLELVNYPLNLSFNAMQCNKDFLFVCLF